MNRYVEEDLEYPDDFTAFVSIYECLHRLEKIIPPRDHESLVSLKEVRASLAHLQSKILKAWHAQRQAEEERRRMEAENAAAATKRRLQERRRALRASASAPSKTRADWGKATPEDFHKLRQILQDVQPMRAKVETLYGAPAHGDALLELQREVNRRCFEAGLPPYVGEHGKHPGYGGHGGEKTATPTDNDCY